MGCEQQTHALMTLNKNISSAACNVDITKCGWETGETVCKRPHSADEFGVKGV